MTQATSRTPTNSHHGVPRRDPSQGPKRKPLATRSVLVTGSARGIGRACAVGLAARGWRVFAGVRKEADGDELIAASQGRIEPITLDVTNPEQIAAAARFVADAVGDRGLNALVNNAGIAIAGPLEFIAPADFRRQLDTNVTGPLALTQPLLGPLRRANGRVVFIGSVSGRIALPFVGPYAASKFALEAIADSLRRELKPQGVAVTIFDLGPIHTSLTDDSIRAAEQRFEQLPPEADPLYRSVMEGSRAVALASLKSALTPEAVLKRLARVLEARRPPKPRYLIAAGGWVFRLANAVIPDALMDTLIHRALVHYTPR